MINKNIFSSRLISNFDWILFGLTIVISVIGVAAIYSTGGAENGEPNRTFIKQIYWILLGLIGMTLILLVDYHLLERFTYIFYIAIIIIFIIIALTGKSILGARRWLSIGQLTFQPSEIAKIILIITLARYFDDRNIRGAYQIRNLAVPFIIVLIPVILIAKQPDLGTAVILFFIFVSMSFFMKINPKSFFILIGSFVLSLPLLWHFMKDYQRNRILTLMNPQTDPLGSGYHIIQSKIAIGSGGYAGKGFMSGTQSQLNFLPEKHTDFIFSVFAEEIGFIGTALLISAYLVILIKGIDVIYHARDRSGALMAIGVVSMLAFHIIFNIGMTTGIFPVVGIPLPFMSYGGSSLITNFMAIGLLLNIKMRRFKEID
jgi:rod shape determining protein RodA